MAHPLGPPHSQELKEQACSKDNECPCPGLATSRTHFRADVGTSSCNRAAHPSAVIRHINLGLVIFSYSLLFIHFFIQERFGGALLPTRLLFPGRTPRPSGSQLPARRQLKLRRGEREKQTLPHRLTL